MLDRASAEAGYNFLTPWIFELAKRRIAEGEGVQEHRCLHNMLSSQPMCFNLFGELVFNPALATCLVQALWGERIASVIGVHIEWAPKPVSDYLNDRTAFDAFIEYQREDGKAGFIGIETKLSEGFSSDFDDKGGRYSRWMTADSPWGADSVKKVQKPSHNQLLRDHLLAWAMVRHTKSRFAEGQLAVVHHPKDSRCSEVIRDYRTHLRDHEQLAFSSHTLDEIVDKWRPFAGSWLSKFEERYLLLDRSAEGTE